MKSIPQGGGERLNAMLRDIESFVTGTPRLILRLEAFCLLAGTLWAFQVQHAGWALFALLLLAPDLSMLGYLVNPKIGAAAYNAAHTTVVYGPLAAYGYLSGSSVALAVGLIGLAHVGFDRLLGFGLKYPLGFGYTHLGHMGKNRSS
jgi:hypothetical protein